jgi:16S rRNA (adenine1518-N6/adenine1519-N6)-dimethyltransferase
MRFRPKKYRGQNFLIDKNIQQKIIKACEITPQDTVLEIGAGRGELTRLIAQKSSKVFALEVDLCLCQILKHNLVDYPHTKIINQNILQFNISNYFKNVSKIKVIGNLPYNITTPIIVHLLKFRTKIGDIFITVQKEPAQRMVASKGNSNWSAFSCFLQYHTEPRILFLIKKTCFWPQPKIDSALVKLSPKKRPPLKIEREKLLFRIIRSGFQQRRKTLRNALRGVVCSKGLNQYFNQYSIDKNIRGEELSLQDFINLTNVIK